ncbi:MAG: nucleotidyltransferase domain-containing protein [Spirochaetaceae bacterium]|nr:MAG: nucleotidyltransferase domain-containing protein [Spirochaetaceae bacterium]
MGIDITRARATLERRRQNRAAELAKREKDAHAAVHQILELLLEKYKPLRVYQWGSLLHEGEFREWSDIDIAVEGLSDPLDGLRAADDASRLTDIPVDLVELDRIDPRHAATIRDEGRLLYERTDSR